MEVILSIVLGAIGIALIWWVLRSILAALPLPRAKKGFLERWKLRKSQRALGEIDSLIDQEQYKKAAQRFPSCLFLEPIQDDPDLIGHIGAHHLAVLNKTILLSDLMERPLSDLAILEDLLNTRIQLLRSRFELRAQCREASRKRAPRWAKEEFRKKEQEVLEKLHTNAATITTQFHRSLEAISGSSSSDSITYH